PISAHLVSGLSFGARRRGHCVHSRFRGATHGRHHPASSHRSGNSARVAEARSGLGERADFPAALFCAGNLAALHDPAGDAAPDARGPDQRADHRGEHGRQHCRRVCVGLCSDRSDEALAHLPRYRRVDDPPRRALFPSGSLVCRRGRRRHETGKPMKRLVQFAGALCAGLLWAGVKCPAEIVFETTSPYHHIRVLDEQGVRTLSFDGSAETRMSVRNPLQGHFEYTEYFHMPWLWNTQMTNALMIGLGGASTQRAYQHYYPDVTVDTVEIDPVVVRVARDYFQFQETPTQRVQVSDGRVFLRRGGGPYGVIILDAYQKNRYGSFIPYQLATREFFELASQRLTTNGVLAYNVIGTLQGWRADILGSIYKTMKGVFPQVYL